MKKYYIPKIEEFYVGFEYERMNGDRWEQDMLGIDDMRSNRNCYENEIEEIFIGLRDVRVKYLDQEDIESLGFICKEPYRWQFNKGQYRLYTEPYTSKESFRIDRGITIKDWVDGCSIFIGVIKNKSELIKILKQLGI